MRYDAVFFDLDGTVIDSLQNITAAVNHAMRHFGYAEQTAAVLRPKLGISAAVLLRSILPADTSEAHFETILAYYKPYYAAHCTDDSGPFEGVLPMLRRMNDAGIRLAILSNKPDAAVQPLVSRYFAELMRLAVGEQPGVRRKPWPDMLINAAEALRVEPCRCLYVGDTEVDIETAKNAGMDCACVTWGFRTREELHRAGATLIVDTPEALLEVVGIE